MRVFYKDSPVAFPLAIGLAALPGTDGKLQWQAEKPLSLPRILSLLPAECTARESCSGKPANVSWNQPSQHAKWGGSKLRETGVGPAGSKLSQMSPAGKGRQEAL